MNDILGMTHEGLNTLLQTHSAMFERAAVTIVLALAGLRFCMFGLNAALSAASGGSGFHFAKFATLLQEVLLVYTMVQFYSTPLPFFGRSFTHLILDQVQYVVNLLNDKRVQEILDVLNKIDMFLPFPGLLEVAQLARVFIIELCIIAAQAATLAVTSYGYVATAIIVLLGPMFIPFKLFPEMEWMFWGWMRAFIQYAFYQIVASAYLFVFGHFLVQILGAKTKPFSSEEMAVLFFPLVLTLVTFILGIIKIPALTFSLFSGRSGDYVLPRWK
jgi:type IV secretory pathway VirB6-like protein